MRIADRTYRSGAEASRSRPRRALVRRCARLARKKRTSGPVRRQSSASGGTHTPAAPDGVRRGAQLMGGDVSYRNGLARRQRGELRWIGHPAGSGVRAERRLVRVTHANITPDPGATDIDGLAGPAGTPARSPRFSWVEPRYVREKVVTELHWSIVRMSTSPASPGSPAYPLPAWLAKSPGGPPSPPRPPSTRSVGARSA